MSDTTLTVQHGPHYSHGALGALDGLAQYRFAMPALGDRPVPGKVFLREPLKLSGAEISFGTLPPGTAIPFLHRHREHEEIYLFLSGSGQMLIDGEVLAVGEGSVVRLAPAAARTWRNDGATPLVYVVLQVKADSLQAGTVEDGMLLAETPSWPAAA